MPTEPQSKTGTGRASNGTYAPGTSGNPAGRPKGVASEARRLGGKEGRKYLKILDAIAADTSETAANRIRAAELMLERGYGKAPAFAPIEGENPLELSDTDLAIESAMDELAARRQAATPGKDSSRAVAGTG